MFLEITLNPLTGCLFSRLLRTVIASQRSFSYHHLVFPTTPQNTMKTEVRFTVTVRLLACPKTLLSKNSFRLILVLKMHATKCLNVENKTIVPWCSLLLQFFSSAILMIFLTVVWHISITSPLCQDRVMLLKLHLHFFLCLYHCNGMRQ